VKDFERIVEGMSDEEREKEIARLTELYERPEKANILGRALCKWILEFVRNCMVVAALFYLARRSGDWWIYGIAGFAGFALVAYCHSYVESVWFQVRIPYEGWRKHVAIISGVLAVNLLLLGMTAGLYVTLDRIVTLQVQMAKAP
jgi:uncharacterized membrane protein